MVKCGQDLKLIRSKVKAKAMRSKMNKESIELIKDSYNEFIAWLNNEMEITDSAQVAGAISESYKKFGYIAPWLEVDSIKGDLEATIHGIQRNESLEVSTLKLDTELQRIRKDASLKFLENAFGAAREVRSNFEMNTNRNLFDVFIINRNGIPGQSIGSVENNSDLNANIRNYKEFLFRRIKEYLLYEASRDMRTKMYSEAKEFFDTAVMFDKLEDGSYSYSGILNDSEFKSKVSNLFAQMSEDTLRLIYYDSNNSSKTELERDYARMRLAAYNAYVLLNNFDSYVSLVLGKAIKILNFNLHMGTDKYALADSTANLATTWRTSENIDVESEADAITKLAINTTPLYRWGNTVAENELFLHFSDFLHMIAKIKALSYNLNSSIITFDEDFQKNHKDIWDNLSNNAKEYLNGKTLRQAINYIRQNPKLYLNIIFELLCNKDFKLYAQDFARGGFTNIYLDFTLDELNKLWSINKGLFNDLTSLRELTLKSRVNDFYLFVTQTADSIFSISYVLYYKDSDGNMSVRTLQQSSIGNIKRKIEQSINSANSSKMTLSLEQFMAEYNMEHISDFNIKGEEIFKGIKFLIPNTSLEVLVLASSGVVTFTEKGKPIKAFNKYANDKNIDFFLDKILRLNISSDPKFKLYITAVNKESGGTDSGTTNKLLLFASRVILNKYVDIKYVSLVEDKKTTINSIFGNNAPKYEYALDLLGLVHGNDIPMLETIAIAKANSDNLIQSSVIKDGDGNAQSLESLSRLLGSIQSQFDLLERNADSVTSECLLLSNPAIFEGLFNAHEYYNGEKAKKFTEMSPSEMSYASLVHDFIGGLIPRKKSSEFSGNGHVMFLPSVNSDKGTIGRMRVNLNVEVLINGETKKLRDLNSGELKQLIGQEFGTIYSRMIDKVKSDLSLISTDLASDFVNGFLNFNEWFYLNPFTFTLKRFGNYIINRDAEGFITIKRNDSDDFATVEAIHNGTEYTGEYQVNYNGTINDPILLANINGALDHILPNGAVVHSNIDFNNPNFKLDVNKSTANNYTFTNVSQGPTLTERRLILNRYKNPILYIKSLVLEYNKTHRLNPLELIDQVHFIESKDSKGRSIISINKAIPALIARFDTFKAREQGIDINQYPSAEEFWHIKNIDILKDMLKSRFKINTTNLNLAELKYIRENYKDWIDSSGNVILAKHRDAAVDSYITNITSETDVIKLGYKNTNEFIEDLKNADIPTYIQLNPFIELYNLLDYLFTLEFMIASVGSFVAHPHKSKSNNVLDQEAGHFNAQHKRNVSYTAAMHAFELNLLNGITEDYNIAVIEDIKDLQGTIGGLLNGIKPFDGATFVNPFIVILENNSLGGAKAGITKKLFVHFKNEKTGTGGIIKTAGFGLTNDWIRNSPFLYHMMKKMTNHVWLELDGRPAVVDLLHNYKKESIIYDKIYFKLQGQYYQVVDIKGLGNNRYIRTAVKINPDTGLPIDGKEFVLDTEGVEINTNFKLWEFLGGKNSMKVVNNKLVPSNTSVENVVKAMNSIGTPIGNPKTIYTLKQLWQPLKHVDVHYVATAGAVKQGGANINSALKYLLDNDEDYDILKIHMYLSGIQLDKEHHADNAELSLMTLVMSACAAKGYTFEGSLMLYNAIAKATETGLKDHFDALSKYFETNDKSSLEEIVIKTVVDNLGNSRTTSGNFAQILASDLISLAKSGHKINYKDSNIPLSDNTVYAKIVSIINSYLTNTGIKLKIPGILSVLTPSYDIMKIWADRKYESFDNPEEELQLIQVRTAPIYDTTAIFNRHSTSFMGKNIIYAASTNGEAVNIDEDGNWIVDRSILAEAFTLNNKGYKNLEEYINYALLDKAMRNTISRDWFKSNELYEKEISNQIAKRLLHNISAISLDRTYNLKYSNTLKASNGEDIVITYNGNQYYIKEDAFIFDLMDYFDPNTGEINVPLGVEKAPFIRENGVIKINNEKEAKKLLLPISKLIKTPVDYINLKKDVADGTITTVTENVTVGRNLASYNVRFSDTNGNQFQLWDLDSAMAQFLLTEMQNLKDLNDINESIRNYYKQHYKLDVLGFESIDLFNNWIESEKIKINRILLRDLMNLSKDTPDVLLLYLKLKALDDGSYSYYDRVVRFVNLLEHNGNGNYISYNGNMVTMKRENAPEIWAILDAKINRLTKVYVNGLIIDVDKKSIKLEAYEVVMPKTFATNFGLNEFDNLNEIANDKDWFIKLYIRNKHVKLSPSQYSIALVNGNGNHYYLLDEKYLLKSKGLHKLDGIITDYIDGKLYRFDANGEIMYELNESDEIYTDSSGTEVIVTRDIYFHINNLHFDDLRLSLGLFMYAEYTLNVLNQLKESKKKQVRRFVRHITKNGWSLSSIFNTLTQEPTETTYRFLADSDPLILMGRAKHTSFLKALDIVAARIPAQSMQSFMPMKVVAFDNPDINTAHVSTMQILLQGSDYDVDAVSLATYDIDRNGNLQTWSPYSNLESIENLNASMELPLPSGLEINLKNVRDHNITINLLEKYKNLITIRSKMKWDKNLKLFVQVPGEMVVEFNTNTVERLTLLKELLESTSLVDGKFYIPEENSMLTFINEANNRRLYDLDRDLWKSVFTGIKKLIDDHNMYYDSLSLYNITKVVNNQLMYATYNIILTPSNLIQAHTSVDGTTGPLKSVANTSEDAQDLVTRTAGNFYNKFLSIVENQIGKKGIGICAVGLKSFFALTLYCNMVLNSGDAKQQERLILGNNHTGKTIGMKTYNTLANIRATDPNTITNEIVLDMLSRTTNDYDAALILSALLSLATDNAKELALSKLNASTAMIGMYIYGVSIGMQFRDIALVLMSEVGSVFNEVLSENVFLDEKGYSKIDYNFFKYFEEGPFTVLLKYKSVFFSDAEGIQESPYKRLENLVTLEFKELDYKDKYGGVNLSSALLLYGSSIRPLSEKLAFFEKYRNLYIGASQIAKELFNQLIDFCQVYVRLMDVITRNLNYAKTGMYDLIKVLAEGALEMRILGLILSTNQGVKTTADKFINQINNFERAIHDLLKLLGKNTEGSIVDIIKFVNDPAYRELVIEEYEQLKHSVNIYDVIATVPHYFNYIKTLAAAKAELNMSFKFRSMLNLSLELKETNGLYDESKLNKGILNFAGDYLWKQWMKHSKYNTIVIPKGNKAYNRDGKLFTLNEEIELDMSTDWGMATFRLWMENEVIPNLLKGMVAPNTTLSTIRENKFIRDLSSDLLTHTLSKNPTIVYTLPINMLPRTELERSIFNLYKAAFNTLIKDNYIADTQSRNLYPISDLFILYSMVAFNNKLGENSLVPILEDYLKSGILEDFHRFEATIDKSDYTLGQNAAILENGVIVDAINPDDLIPYITPKGNDYSSNSLYIFSKDKETGKWVLKLKSMEGLSDSIGDVDVDVEYKIDNGKYFLDSNFSHDLNIFPSSGDVLMPGKENMFFHKGFNMYVSYDIDGTIKTIKVESLEQGSRLPDTSKLSEIKKVIEKNKNGKMVLDTQLFGDIVYDKLFSC